MYHFIYPSAEWISKSSQLKFIKGAKINSLNVDQTSEDIHSFMLQLYISKSTNYERRIILTFLPQPGISSITRPVVTRALIIFGTKTSVVRILNRY